LALPAGLLLVLLVLGQATIQLAVRRFLSNALQNGFFEEFLFRGALQTRLGYVMGPASALVSQALLFGLWHLGGNVEMVGGNWAGGLAVCVLSQGVSGLIFGLVFQRTRNLLAPACAHIGMNVLGQTVAF
jgi:membrane protease YdiL (CAAX protease family)